MKIYYLKNAKKRIIFMITPRKNAKNRKTGIYSSAN